ncbi:DUF3021 family protein [Paenibacillus aurantiacus]|uniref:DUF3021 family protein n=1 Tax=Paenibacillus aurantiacus TaxID=1936118 RepID=A0ABV5KKV4_9BACL
MKLFAHLHKLTMQFFIIFASIMMMLTVLRQLYDPNLAFDLKSIYTIMVFSLAAALTGLILYAPEQATERQMRMRMAVHFIALEAILVALAAMMGLVEQASGVLLLAAQIAVVYAIVRLLSWRSDRRSADEINAQLRAWRNKGE